MKKRKLGRTDLYVTEVGLGCEHLEKQPYSVVDEVVNTAVDAGVNIFDVFMPEPNVRSFIGAALADRRKDVYLQGHLGVCWHNDQYERTRDITLAKGGWQDFIERTGYPIDIGMLHYIDTMEDFEAVKSGGLWDAALKLKQDGAITTLGFSSHVPTVALEIVKTGEIDAMMFSFNPIFDLHADHVSLEYAFEKFPEGGHGISPVRAQLYAECEKRGVGITVMKSLAAGWLLSAEKSPFKRAMTVPQCMHYALSRPGVSSVLVGCRNKGEVIDAIKYETASDAERDFSFIANAEVYGTSPACMYCNHCLPCPAEIDVAQVTKCLDLFDGSDAIKQKYAALSQHASDCLECGSCESNCPFGIKVIENMRRAKATFDQ